MSYLLPPFRPLARLQYVEQMSVKAPVFGLGLLHQFGVELGVRKPDLKGYLCRHGREGTIGAP